MMKIKTLVGAGDQIMGFTLPFALVGIIMNVIYPEFFRMNLGLLGIILGSIFLLIGVPIWLTSAVQVLVCVPRNKLITTGPFAIVLHPLYSSVSLFVIPGVSLVLDTWVGIGIGAILYIFSRLFSVKEEKQLDDIFSNEYRSYRSKVLLPWI
jgi:protein-S-isoprenylcysteine O-methyltransferase Ste14